MKFAYYPGCSARSTCAELNEATHRVAKKLGLATHRLPSGAGHDAQMMALLGPMGMIFIPSVNGISHSPHELSKWEAIAQGANVLFETVLLEAA